MWKCNILYPFHCRTFSTVIWCPTQSVSWKPGWSLNWRPSQFVLRCLMRTAWSTSTPGRGWSRNPTCQSGADLSDPRLQEAYQPHQVRKRNLSFRGRHSWKKIMVHSQQIPHILSTGVFHSLSPESSNSSPGNNCEWNIWPGKYIFDDIGYLTNVN